MDAKRKIVVVFSRYYGKSELQKLIAENCPDFERKGTFVTVPIYRSNEITGIEFRLTIETDVPYGVSLDQAVEQN